MSSFRAGVDIGGTFTDTVMVDEAGAVSYVKVPSTPPDFYEGLVEGVTRLGRPLGEMALLAHGTTVGINAIIARRGARTAVVTTKGQRDLLAIRRGDREAFNLWWQPPPPLVPRKHRFELDERVAYDGSVLRPPTPRSSGRAAPARPAAGRPAGGRARTAGRAPPGRG